MEIDAQYTVTFRRFGRIHQWLFDDERHAIEVSELIMDRWHVFPAVKRAENVLNAPN